MKLIFVHGWSVANTDTYGRLPEAIETYAPADLNIDVQHIYLGRYISFHDEVTVDDIARAFEHARKEVIGEDTKFSCVTHSTGGPVMRAWIERYYGADNLSQLPLDHLIMLAPANFGSALAQLGKGRISRILSWLQGVEPGQGVLNWLELGSDGQRDLNINWLKYDSIGNGFYPFVITGEYIDKSFYDYLNSYTDEDGSDGVVRVAAANLNYRYVKLEQTDEQLGTLRVERKDRPMYRLAIDGGLEKPMHPCAMEVVEETSHSGDEYGIMFSVTDDNAGEKQVVKSIIESLQVNDVPRYENVVASMNTRSNAVQKDDKYTMLVFRITDDQGNLIRDYDLYLLAGDEYHPGKLPKGFFVDRQKNSINQSTLVYYLNDSKMQKIQDGKFGVRIVARPIQGFSYYAPAEFRSEHIPASDLLIGNETLIVDIKLKRKVDSETFVLDPLSAGRKNFKKVDPNGTMVD